MFAAKKKLSFGKKGFGEKISFGKKKLPSKSKSEKPVKIKFKSKPIVFTGNSKKSKVSSFNSKQKSKVSNFKNGINKKMDLK
ncbi:MAG: hypothetical protein GY750_03600 [Lentisphaerae bacterium]|nr:hypothetical protein [Lentisphaerota bacterium]MCP4100502.1 hypothetical protein [Lentisphaerota bacterium]